MEMPPTIPGGDSGYVPFTKKVGHEQVQPFIIGNLISFTFFGIGLLQFYQLFRQMDTLHRYVNSNSNSDSEHHYPKSIAIPNPTLNPSSDENLHLPTIKPQLSAGSVEMKALPPGNGEGMMGMVKGRVGTRVMDRFYLIMVVILFVSDVADSFGKAIFFDQYIQRSVTRGMGGTTHLPKSIFMLCIMDGWITSMTHIIYVVRIIRITPNRGWWVWCGIVISLITSVAQFVGSIVTGIFAWSPTQTWNHKMIISAPVWLGGASFVDWFLCLVFCWHLSRHRSAFRSTNDMVTRWVAFTLETGLLTSVLQALDLVLFVTFREKPYHIAVATILPKIYIISILLMLRTVYAGRLMNEKLFNPTSFTAPRLSGIINGTGIAGGGTTSNLGKGGTHKHASNFVQGVTITSEVYTEHQLGGIELQLNHPGPQVKAQLTPESSATELGSDRSLGLDGKKSGIGKQDYDEHFQFQIWRHDSEGKEVEVPVHHIPFPDLEGGGEREESRNDPYPRQHPPQRPPLTLSLLQEQESPDLIRSEEPLVASPVVLEDTQTIKARPVKQSFSSSTSGRSLGTPTGQALLSPVVGAAYVPQRSKSNPAPANSSVNRTFTPSPPSPRRSSTRHRASLSHSSQPYPRNHQYCDNTVEETAAIAIPNDGAQSVGSGGAAAEPVFRSARRQMVGPSSVYTLARDLVGNSLTSGLSVVTNATRPGTPRTLMSGLVTRDEGKKRKGEGSEGMHSSSSGGSVSSERGDVDNSMSGKD